MAENKGELIGPKIKLGNFLKIPKGSSQKPQVVIHDQKSEDALVFTPNVPESFLKTSPPSLPKPTQKPAVITLKNPPSEKPITLALPKEVKLKTR